MELGRDNKQRTVYVVGKAKVKNKTKQGKKEKRGGHAILYRYQGVGI